MSNRALVSPRSSWRLVVAAVERKIVAALGDAAQKLGCACDIHDADHFRPLASARDNTPVYCLGSRLAGRLPRLPIVKALVRIVAGRLPDADVRTSADGFAAGILVASFHPHVLLLTPSCPGSRVSKSVAGSVGAGSAGTSIVIVSVNLTGEIKAELLDIGAKRCIAKPFERTEIITVVTDLLPEGVRR